MIIQQTTIGHYEGKLAGQQSWILFPTRMEVIRALSYLSFEVFK